MKIARIVFRLALLSLAAAAFVWLTKLLGASVRTPPPFRDWQTVLVRRPAWPELLQFPDVIGECLLMVFFGLVGRVALRLRLSAPSRSEGQPISLKLR